MNDVVIRDCYIKLVDPTGRNSPSVSAHRVYDFPKFIESQKQTHEVKAKDGDKRTVVVIDEAEYKALAGVRK